MTKSELEHNSRALRVSHGARTWLYYKHHLQLHLENTVKWSTVGTTTSTTHLLLLPISGLTYYRTSRVTATHTRYGHPAWPQRATADAALQARCRSQQPCRPAPTARQFDADREEGLPCKAASLMSGQMCIFVQNAIVSCAVRATHTQIQQCHHPKTGVLDSAAMVPYARAQAPSPPDSVPGTVERLVSAGAGRRQSVSMPHAECILVILLCCSACPVPIHRKSVKEALAAAITGGLGSWVCSRPVDEPERAPRACAPQRRARQHMCVHAHGPSRIGG